MHEKRVEASVIASLRTRRDVVRQSTFVAAVAAAALAVAAGACGDDDGEVEQARADTPQLKGALQECYGQIYSDTENGDAPVSSDLRAALRADCRAAIGDGIGGLRQAQRDVCRAVIERTVPRGTLAFEMSLGHCDDGTRPLRLPDH